MKSNLSETENLIGSWHEDTRPPEPEIVRTWRKGPPKCCHTCDNYNAVGYCYQHQESPPAEFAAQINSCDQWVREIPF